MAHNVSAIILAAGESQRMGQPKLLLPWGGRTVLGQVVSTFAAAGIEEIVVVTGGTRELVEEEVGRLARQFPARAVYNPEYARDGMLSSIQRGIGSLGLRPRAALIGLGDQPQVREDTVRATCVAFVEKRAQLVVPTHGGRRGHPWLAARPLWDEILSLPASITPRQFLAIHAGKIEYVETDDSILQDLDTPEDYASQRP
ncbi:MAG: nucleotidyltransferase family protein [Chloroflexi bacterium]|nr:nucleotidyltransferase family protein [Chloroflexota bacterium]